MWLAIWHRVIGWFSRGRILPPPRPGEISQKENESAANKPGTLLQTQPSPETEPEPAPSSPEFAPPKPRPTEKDKIRRRLERARKRYDVFVEPKDDRPTAEELPPTKPPKPRKPKVEVEPAEPLPEVPDAEMLIYETGKFGEGVLIAESEVYGEFNFRDTVLDQLDRYFVYLRRMRKSDPTAWGFYKQVGITMVPLAATHMTSMQFRGVDESPDKEPIDPHWLKLSPWFKQNRPGFGCVAYGTNSYFEKAGEDREKKRRAEAKGAKWTVYHPSFMYFRKYNKPPPQIQLVNGGDIYSVTIHWDRTVNGKPSKSGDGVQDFFLFVSKDGETVQLLKVHKSSTVRISGKRSRQNGRRGRKSEGAQFKRSGWEIPADLVRWSKENGATPEQYLVKLFCDVVRYCEDAAYSMVRIAVSKGDMTATFGVNIKRIGYFFQDRDVQLSENGVKRRIFHLVRAHERETKNGKTTVPFHFRGLREFDWAGYQVKITVPGRDHFMLSEFDIPAMDDYWDDKSEKTISEPQMGKQLVKWMDEGLGGRGPS